MPPRPLVLEVDGAFLRTDLLYESFWNGLGRALRHMGDRERLKAELAAVAPPRVELLPVNPAMLALARARQAEGGEVMLAAATAADRVLVEPLARHHGLSSRVFAPAEGRGDRAAALVEAFGPEGFDYAGNAAAGQRIWRAAATAYLMGHVPATAPRGPQIERLEGGGGPRGLWKAMRPHQWVKNILLFLPVIAAHDFTLSSLLLVLLGILAFSAAASAIYIVNDLLDLEADRLHPTKRARPFAAGEVPIRTGMASCGALALLALALGALLGGGFLAVLACYMALSLAYSLKLKRMRWIDIFTLAGLYTLRVVAGAAASRVEVSIYMLIFIFPVFLSLGCVKRLTELALAKGDAPLPGRGYGRRDRGDLLNMACLGIVGALVIWGLYIVSPQGATLYPTEWIMWVAMVPIALWLIRMVLLGYHGRQDYDPIVFALRDKMGIGLLLITLSLMFWAAGLWAEWFGG
jgi:4-hydroxybenzoate polyprenyltransferase